MEWSVAGAVIEGADGLLLVCNRRRGGRMDWSPPGGVIDPGEDVVTALTREVHEETGLTVARWSEPLYRISASAPDMGWELAVEARQSLAVSGAIVHDDPDGIVVDHVWADQARTLELLSSGPRWVSEPLLGWLNERWDEAPTYRYEVRGSSVGDLAVELLEVS
jgi:8-oxo-dGTP diphosphatase